MLIARFRREIDVPAGELPMVIEKLCRLSERERRAGQALSPGTVLDYAASLRVFDDTATGRVLAVWTAAIPVPGRDDETVQSYRDAAFADFLEQLRHECSSSIGAVAADGLVGEQRRDSA